MSVSVRGNQTIFIHVASNTMQEMVQETFEVNKQLIMEKSAYFRIMCLNSPNIQNYTVNCDAKIFRIAIDVINGSVLSTTVNNLDNLIYLEATTEIFQMDELKEACVQLMAKSVNFQTVWKIYDTNHAPVIENCEWLLKTRTKDLLAHPHFMDIKPETLARFLRLEEMNIESESFLLKAMLCFLESGKHASVKDVFRNYALPHLRVKNMISKSNYDTICSFLDPEEMLLLSFLMNFTEKPVLHLPIFCLDTRPRRSEDSRVLVIEPDNDTYDSADLEWRGLSAFNLVVKSNKFVMSFVTKRRIMLKRIFFFCPIIRRLSIVQFDYCIEPGGVLLPNDMVTSSFKISSPLLGEIVSVIKPSNMNKIAFMKLNVFVPESACVSVEVEFNDLYYYHRIEKSEAAIFESSDPCVQEVLENVTLRYLRDGQEVMGELIPTVFKSVHMDIV